MQSGYGGVSEFQQFIMDSAFAMSAPPPPQPAQPPPPTAGGQELGGPFRYQPLHHHALPPQHHHHHAPPMPPHFAHFAGGGIPFTQQLLHQAATAAGHHPHLQLFQEQHHHHHHHKPPQPPPQQQPTRWAPQHPHPHHHHHLGFDVEAAVPESSGAAGGSTASGGGATPGVPPFLAAAMNFKLAVDAGGGSAATGGTDDALNDGGGGGGGGGMMLHVGGAGADDEAATESRLRRWPGDEETSIKEPTWRPLDIDYLHSTSSSKRTGKEKAPTPESPAPAAAAAASYFKKGDDSAAAAAAASAGGGNYKLFSELEAIYKPGSGGTAGAQTGSGSGLTGDDNVILEPAMPDLPGPEAGDAPQLNTSDTSAGEDVAAVVQRQPQPSSDTTRRKRKRRRQEHLSASASFFERLVQRLMEHQESLHRQFLEAMERRERERAARNEEWRRQEAEKFAREVAARAQDRASAAAREAAIIAYLEKLSGESINLPPPAAPSAEDISQDAVGKELVAYEGGEAAGGSGALHMSTSRWPKHEVEALIRVRTGLEGRFQEPGLKGPLWEEVSARMAAAGYGRSAKRCKEKWENINKYFRKAKESGKKRPSQAKTCPYFDELDRLYSRSSSSNANAGSAGGSGGGAGDEHDAKASSELLDAVVKYPEGPPGFVYDDKDPSSVDAKAPNSEVLRKEGEEGGIGSGRATDDPEPEDHQIQVEERHGEDDQHE